MIEDTKNRENARCLERGTSFLYDDYIEEGEAFRQWWGGDDPATLLRVLEEGKGDDRLVAIGALAERGEHWVREHLLPLLSDPNEEVQRISALVLGGLFDTMREEQAVPRLIQMLTEMLPTEGSGPLFERDMWIWYAARVLGSWHLPGVVPGLRHALATIWSRFPAITSPVLTLWYREYQNDLTFALGCLGAFGVLTGLQSPSEGDLQEAVICMACAAAGIEKKPRVYLHSFLRRYDPFRGEQERVEQFKVLARVLEERFGLTQQEQKQFFGEYNKGHRSAVRVQIFRPGAS